jgi:hypothetical protein
MKNTLLILFSFIFFLQSNAQSKSNRRIYLWDVTLSMKGYQGNTADIYDKIVKFLENEINSISDESTEIVVCPFQETILDTWKANASDAGKQTIIDKIKAYNNPKVTGTNIVVPIQSAQNKLIKPDKHNLLILLTDGKQTGGNDSLLQLISKWEKYANINDAFALYVMLTEEAICQDIIDTIKKTDNIEVVTKPGQAAMIDLQPSNPIKVNLKNDKTATISFNYKKGVILPSNINIQVYSNNQCLTINQKTTLKDSKISFTINYKKDYNTLKIQLAETTKIPLKISIDNRDELKEAGKIVYLTKENLTLELINKPEKTLKISIKKK